MSTGWIKQGNSAMDEINRVEKDTMQRKDRPYMPLRYFSSRTEETEIIILDHAFVSDEQGVGGALIREHRLKNAEGIWKVYESCCADFAPCALCDKAGAEGFGAAGHVVIMSILVLKPWTNKKTGEEHAYSRMLMAIPLNQKERFLDLQKVAFRQSGTMRGMYLVMKRAPDQQSAAIGEPVMLDNGKLFDMISEEELVKDYGHPALKNREGNVIKAANADLQPFDYALLFPRPDPTDLAHRFGGRPLAGSRIASQEIMEPTQTSSPPPRRRSAPQQEVVLPESFEQTVDMDSIPSFDATDSFEDAEASAEPKAPMRARGARSPNAPW